MIQVRSGTAALIATALVTVVVSNLHAQSLKGSPESVDRMYSAAVQNGFEFLKTSASVNAAVNAGKLVRLTGNSDYELDAEVQYPFVMSEARLFVERLAEQYRAGCGERLVVTGGTRPLDMKLRNGSPLSVHPTGMAVDLRKANISGKCRKWLTENLLKLEKAGVLEATSESRPAHFHVAVFPATYANYVAALTNAANAQTQTQTRSTSSGPAESPDLALVSYLVRSGDSLWRIAMKHDTTVTAIQELNKLKTNTIHPGQVILVPKLNGSK